MKVALGFPRLLNSLNPNRTIQKHTCHTLKNEETSHIWRIFCQTTPPPINNSQWLPPYLEPNLHFIINEEEIVEGYYRGVNLGRSVDQSPRS